MAGGVLGLAAKLPKGPAAPVIGDDTEGGDDESPLGSPGEMAAEDFASAKTGAERYAAFKRMFKACEAEGHSEGAEEETEDEY